MNADDDRPDELGFGELPHEIPPPPGLEQRVVTELRERGLIDRRIAPQRRWLLAASLAAAFSAGFLAGELRETREAPATERSATERYLLLLYEPRPIAGAEADLVAEYSAWAGELAGRGQLVAAEKLGAAELRLGTAEPSAATPSGGGDEPTGFFLLEVKSRAEAERIARDCPHLRHGGEVSLRPVEKT